MAKKVTAALMQWMGGLLFVTVLALELLGAKPVAPYSKGLQEVSHTALPATATQGAPLIVLDAGHGGQDGGAVGTHTGVVEAGLNLAIAKMVQKGLEQSGVSVIMTRETEDAIGETKQKDMKRRGEILKTEGVTAVVSIHMNKFKDRSVKGPMVFYMKGSEAGQVLATELIDSICDAIGNPRRLANPGDYYVLRACEAPAALVECGFLSNQEEEKKLQEPEYQALLAKAIVDGIMSYFNGLVD